MKRIASASRASCKTRLVSQETLEKTSHRLFFSLNPGLPLQRQKLCNSLGILVFALLLFSCATRTGIVFDDSVPVEKSTWIAPSNVGTVVGYNGIEVKWTAGSYELIQIPAGETLLELNVNGSVNFSRTILRGEGALFRYNFQPGKKYILLIQRKDDVYGLNVYAYEYEEKIAPSMEDMEKHLVGFTPFLNMVVGKTVLN